ncbi:hypothetical protein ABBQ32_002637 [Trebouxia sp. C0010 RCD-2024]
MWTYDQCLDGYSHKWLACGTDRTRGTGCIGRQVCKHNSLAAKAPLVAAQWDYQANDHTPDDVCAPDAKTKKRTKHPTFADGNHPLLAEWDYERNAAQGHFPDEVRLRSNKIFWLCAKCPAGQEHSWSAQPNSRTGCTKLGCPFCVGQAACTCNSLQALFPDTAAEWDYGKNQGHPSDYTAGSIFLAWWSSPKRAGWQQSIISRTKQLQQKRTRKRQASAGAL